MRLDMRGESRVGTLIFIAAAIIVVYVLVKLVPPYMHYYAMDDEVHQQLKLSKINVPATIKEDILEKSREVGIDLHPENVEISYDDEKNLAIYIYWSEVVDFGYGFTKELTFEIDTSEDQAEE